MEIYANATHAATSDNTSQCIPQENGYNSLRNKVAILDKRRKVKGNPSGGGSLPKPPMRRVNTHITKDHVNLDDIIEYTVNTHLSQGILLIINLICYLRICQDNQLLLKVIQQFTFDMFLMLNEIMLARWGKMSR
jgi:hypothetical protein